MKSIKKYLDRGKWNRAKKVNKKALKEAAIINTKLAVLELNSCFDVVNFIISPSPIYYHAIK